MDNQNNGKTIQKLSDEELEATSGGSFIDDVVCFVAGHMFVFVCYGKHKQQRWPRGCQIDY